MQAKSENDEARSVLGTTGEPLTNQRKDRFMADANATPRKAYKPILNLDFDGVIHSYSSGWKGAAVIPDPPVPGALDFIHDAIAAGWDVCIHSSRSHQWGGRRAMKRWLIHFYREMFWERKDIQDAAGDPYSWTHADIDEDALLWGAHVVQQVRFPWFKPAATVSIDDRAITFTGNWPDLSELRRFKPWNKQ